MIARSALTISSRVGLVALVEGQEPREDRGDEDRQEQEVQHQTDQEAAGIHPEAVARAAVEPAPDAGEQSPHQALGDPAERQHDDEQGGDAQQVVRGASLGVPGHRGAQRGGQHRVRPGAPPPARSGHGRRFPRGRRHGRRAAAIGSGAAALSSWASRSSRTSASLSRATNSRIASRVSGSGSFTGRGLLRCAAGWPAATAASGRSEHAIRQSREPAPRALNASWVSSETAAADGTPAADGPRSGTVGDPTRPSYCNRAGQPPTTARLGGRPAGAGPAGAAPTRRSIRARSDLGERREHRPDARRPARGDRRARERRRGRSSHRSPRRLRSRRPA